MCIRDSFLRRLRGGCQVAAGALARIEQAEDDLLHIEGVLASEDGSTCLRAKRSGPRSEGTRLGTELAEELLQQGGEALIRNPEEPQQ